MNKVLKYIWVLFGVTLWGGGGLYGQPSILSSYGPGYVKVESYEGATISGHVFHFQLRNPMNVSNWSLRARINGPIMASTGANVSGQPFPADKIQFKFTGTGTGTPSPAQISVPLHPQPLQVGQTVIIASSAAPLVNGPNSYHQFRVDYDVIIAGGAYLDQMKHMNPYNHVQYHFPIVFELYDAQGQLISQTTQSNFNIQIPPVFEGQAPEPPMPDFSLEILGEAVDGTLNFSSLESYINGEQVRYSDAVKIHAKTGFELHVRSRSHQFMSTTGQVLPVEVLQVRLRQGSAPPASAQYFTVQTSTQPHLLMSTNQGSPTPLLLDLEYRTEGHDQRLIDAPAGKYSAVLVYELIPR